MLNVEVKDPGLNLPELPEAVAKHPGMISKHERQLLYGLARDHYEGRGQIIDAGTFLGASIAAFSHGLHDGGRREYWKGDGKPIISFERAVVEPYYQRHAKKHYLPELSLNNSFEAVLRELISAYKDDVELHIGDILAYDGEDLTDIEICFLDILKTPSITKHCLKMIFPKLLVGSYVIHQDYFFHDLPEIKVAMETLMEYFEYLGEVRSSAIFKLRRPITQETIGGLLESRPLEEQLKLHRAAELRTQNESRQYLMQLSRALLLAEHGDADAASATWKEANETYPSIAFKADGKTYNDNISWRFSKLENNINSSKNISMRNFKE